MTNYKVEFTVAGDSNDESFHVQLDDVELQVIPAVREDQEVTEPDITAPGGTVTRTKSVVTVQSRMETQDEAILRALQGAVGVEDFEKANLTTAEVEVSYTVSGSVTLELDEEDLEDYNEENLSYELSSASWLEDRVRDELDVTYDADLEITDVDVLYAS